MSMPVLGFTLCIAFVVYVLVGYPVALALWARLFPKQNSSALLSHPVYVIIPVRNGASWVTSKLNSLLASTYPPELLSVLVVSDGSTDGTNQLVSDYGDPRVKLLPLPPGGKAKAVSAAFEFAKARTAPDAIFVLTDVRQDFDCMAIQHLVAGFSDPTIGVVTGELVIRQGNSHEEYNTGLYWKYEKWIRGNLNRIDAMLGATGSIYAIRRDLAVSIPPDILLDDVYLPLTAALSGSRIYFENRAKAYDSPTSLHSEFWRKVRTQAGVYQIVARFPSLLNPANHRFIHFLSHKLGRLFLPYALAAALILSFFLPGALRTAALTSQAFFYGLALLDPWIPERHPVKRLSAVIRAFIVLVAAAACAIKVFFTPARQLWKETKVSISDGHQRS